MRLIVNGETKDLEAGTVADVLVALGLPLERVAVEHNGVIVRRADRATVVVHADDRLEIVTLVGGG